MYKEAIKNKNPMIRVSTEEEFRELLKTVDESTQIFEGFPEAVKIIEDVGNESFSVLNDKVADGDYALQTTCGAFPLTESAVTSVIARGDMTNRLLPALFEKGLKEEAVGLLNQGLSLKEKIREEGARETQVVVRGGWAIANMSDQWSHIPQSQLGELCLKKVREEFPGARLEKCVYTHDLTEFWIGLGDHDSEIMQAYKTAWVASGLSEESLKKVRPVIRVCTSDTGFSSVVVLPILQDGKYNRILGERLSTKHAGSNSLKEVEKDLEKAFSRARQSLDKIADLMATPITYGTSVMVAALEHGKRSIYSLNKGVCEQVLEHFALMFGGEKVTAYDIYTAIGEIEYSDALKNLKENSAIQIVEAIYRLIDLDWKSLDQPTKSYLGKSLKKKGGK